VHDLGDQKALQTALRVREYRKSMCGLPAQEERTGSYWTSVGELIATGEGEKQLSTENAADHQIHTMIIPRPQLNQRVTNSQFVAIPLTYNRKNTARTYSEKLLSSDYRI
jgi:hypothetical protein